MSLPAVPADHYSPYPEIVLGDPTPYEICETDDMAQLPVIGMTNKVARILYVPLDTAGQAVRRHEQGHVKWSPDKVPRVRYNTYILLAVEDARVNVGLRRVGLPVEFTPELRSAVVGHARVELERGLLASVIVRAVAGLGTNAADDLLAVIEEQVPERAQWARDLVATVGARLHRSAQRRRRPVASFGQVMAVGRWLARQLQDEGRLPERGSGVVACACFGHAPRLSGASGLGDPVFDETIDLDLGPGRMHIATPPLTRPCGPVGPGRGRLYRPRLEGAVVAYPWEIYTTRRIFRRSVRRCGATVLIDASGSMDLDADDVEAILAASPAPATVAMYSGTGEEGELRIVGRGNRRAQERDLVPYGSGNIVDVPALRWLARQPPPRIWISDAAVTGKHDTSSQRIDRECARICRAAGIVRVEGTEEAMELMR